MPEASWSPFLSASGRSPADALLRWIRAKALVESSGEFEFAEGGDVKLKGMTGSHQVFGVKWDEKT